MQSSYTYTRMMAAPSIVQALEVVKKSFALHGWGLPPGTTALAMHDIFKAKKIDDTFPETHILGFCHPQTAWKALTLEPGIAVLLPCNVVVRTTDSDCVFEVASIAPSAMASMVDDKKAFGEVIADIDARMVAALDDLPKPSEGAK